jgi:peptidoglycan/xylan/chitin deacetylase (PgdA/CDA1 family)
MVLTLDACGGPGGEGYDEALVALLRREGIAATLFLAARWVDAHPDEARALADERLFELANHGAAHKPCSVTGRAAFGIPGTDSPASAREEIRKGGQRIAELTGGPPRFYRPGTGFYDAPCGSWSASSGSGPSDSR